jgi:hypothetical protein
MDTRTALIATGGLFTVGGYMTAMYARARYRTALAPGLAPTWRGGRPRREWFSSENGWRLSQSARWLMFLGGVISIVGSRL